MDVARLARAKLQLLEKMLTAVARSAGIGQANFKRTLKASGLSRADTLRGVRVTVVVARRRGEASLGVFLRGRGGFKGRMRDGKRGLGGFDAGMRGAPWGRGRFEACKSTGGQRGRGPPVSTSVIL